ncbi:MAG: hypothetical protein RBS38_01755 [Bacteroidales bacterium]|jgi:hypothetical protein|nr:hypothetical protein [Bacteroidales bacterium]
MNLLDFGWVFEYLYIMKDELTIPEHIPDNEEEDLRREEGLKAAALRRERYSLVRDKQAKDNNEAITKRLAREKKNTSEEKE